MEHAILYEFHFTVPVEFVPVQQSITVTELQDVKLSCKALGRPIPEISWMFNGTRIAGNLLII